MSTSLSLTNTLTGEVFTFARFERPESIPMGGEQQLVVHRMVGGLKKVDAMGANPAPLEWSGWFVGANGLTRALYLDGLRKAGTPVEVRFSELYYSAVIRTFTPDYQMEYRIPYRISLEVVKDLTSPVSAIALPSIDQLIFDDIADCQALVDSIGSPGLSSAFSTFTTAVSKVTSFVNAAKSTVKSVLYPLQAVRNQTSILLSSASSTINSVSTLGGILPNNSLSNNILRLSNQIYAVGNSSALMRLDKVLSRVDINMNQINSSIKTVTVAGVSLYQVASKMYGDPMGWTAIAKANNLTDPNITDAQTLVIPPYNDGSNGVLND